MASLEELEQRRAKRRAEHDKAREAQELDDLTAIDALEEAKGAPLHTMTANAFKIGHPVKIAFRAPTAAEYKRYADMVGIASKQNDSKARLKAQEMLAQSCLEYPVKDSDQCKAMLEAIPGVLVSLAIEAAKVAELRAEEEGKG